MKKREKEREHDNNSIYINCIWRLSFGNDRNWYLEKKTVTAADGRIWEAEYIITTIPWRSFETIEGMPQEIVSSVKKLKSSAIETRYIGEKLDTKAQWLYIPDEKKPYHRILVRHNFCQGSRGYWLETRNI